MPTVNLITSAASLLSGDLEECQTTDDETCQGGVAAVLALARNHTLNSLNEPEPYTFIQKFDKNSPFVNMHPLQWVVNRLVLREIFQLEVFISTPSLLLQNKVDSEVSQRDISDLQTHGMPFLLTNADVPSSNSWHEYVKASYFDPKTGLAIASLADHGVPMSITAVEAARGFLNYVAKINKENGCFSERNAYQDYLINNPILEIANPSIINNTLANQCWVTVLLFSDIEARYWPFLEAIIKVDHPPNLIVNLEHTYETFNEPQLYEGTSWVASCAMNQDNYCQQRIELTEEGEDGTRQPRIQNVEFIGQELETLSEELKDDQWRQHILQLRPLADAAEQNNPIVGNTAAMPISRIGEYRACESGECPLGSLFTDAIRWFTGTDIGFTSSGGYRGEGWPGGPVRLTDLYASLPFPNTECAGTMSGLSLYKLLNYTTSVATFEGEKTSEGGRLLQVSGMKVTYNTLLNETRLVAVDVWDLDQKEYAPLDPLKLYTFSSDSYVCGAYDPYPDLTGGDFKMAGEVPAVIGENLVQNIVAEYLGSLEEPWDTESRGRLVNNTSIMTPMKLIQDSTSCPQNYVWDPQSQNCFECPSLDNVVFSDQSLSFQANSGVAVVEGGRILMVNREPIDVIVRFKSKPTWFQFTSAATKDVEIDRVDNLPISLPSGDSLVLDFSLMTSLGTGVDRTALGTVSFGVAVGSGFQGCAGKDTTFDVDLRVTPPDNYNYLGNFLYVGVAFATIVFLTSLSFTAFVYINRNTRVIKVMQPMFLVTICWGVAVLGSSMIPLGIDDGMVSESGVEIACMSVPWLLSTGFSLAFSALFSKLWRINKLFNQSSGIQRIVVRGQDVLKPLFILLTINIGLLIAWTVTDPLEWQRFSIDGQEWNTYGQCVGGTASTVFVSLIAAFNFIALVMACVQAYLARNISDEFSESKYIGIAIYGWLQTCLIGVPIIFLIDDGNPTAQYFLQVTMVFVVCMSMVSIIFAPAFVNFKKRSRGNSHRVSVTGIRPTATRVSQSGEFIKQWPNPSCQESADSNPWSRKVQLAVLDSIDERTEEAVEQYHHDRITGNAESKILESAAKNRQKMMENNPVGQKDSSMVENIQNMMAAMEDSSSDED
ncbi:7 transmembrane sweet-taste receptor of 3 GCPR domain containing protein [Nitzschia inconspicua]|uniref:7 transmembrane sweet-taste receptor of 3 GCPR domain containing protein n=1 Tax=Nitzschia inconspicua TaxID=303405 RepID=A0A9K3Q9F5_9STRA|nr:7 transmembrane sweet-taste receptor of 3 GCPR domain containing protein [Nitzschia inconspicua]